MSIIGSGTISGASAIGTSNAMISYSNDIVKYYNFNSNILNFANSVAGVADATFYSGGIVATPTYSTSIFKVGTASISFAGTTTGLAIAPYTRSIFGHTVTFWCYCNAAANNASNNTIFYIGNSTQTIAVNIFINTNILSVGTTPGGNWATGYTIPDNIWTHIAIVFYPNNTIILYVNGAYQNQTTTYVYQNFTSVSTYSVIAARVIPPIGANLYVGYLDDFRLYESTLTSGQVSTIYNFR